MAFIGEAAAITRILEDRPGTTGLIVLNEAIISPLASVLRAAGRWNCWPGDEVTARAARWSCSRPG